VRVYIQETLTRDISGLKFLRGPETLNYTRRGVSGNLEYFSNASPGSRYTAKLEKEIASRFSGYKARISLRRIADESALEALKKERESTLENSPTTLNDRVRHAASRDLVRRSLELLRRRFPEEIGYVASVKLSFDLGGIDTVHLEYLGKQIPRRSRDVLSLALRNELRELKGATRRVRITRRGSLRGQLGCRGRARAEDRIQQSIKTLFFPLESNSELNLELLIDPALEKMIVAEQLHKKGVKISRQTKRVPCRVYYSYSNHR